MPLGIKDRRIRSDDDVMRPLRITRTMPLTSVLSIVFAAVVSMLSLAYSLDRKLTEAVAEMRALDKGFNEEKISNKEVRAQIFSILVTIDNLRRELALLQQRVDYHHSNHGRKEQ